jgi:hypothetical protein
MATKRKTAEDFWARVKKTPGCWTGPRKATLDGVQERAARIAWRITYGDESLESGARVVRTCNNPRCVNPGHLALAPTTPAIREQIRQAYASGNVTHQELGRRFGVSRTYVTRMLNA